MKLDLRPKTKIICLTCRQVMAEVEYKFIFPKVYDFCPKCTYFMEQSFKRQIDGA